MAEHFPRLAGGRFPVRAGDKAVPSQVLTSGVTSRPGIVLSPTGFALPLPNRSPARARGLNPRSGPR